MDTNRIITYSLLAHINNNISNKGIKDLSDIFIPLVKRVISKLYQQGINKGLITDLKTDVDSTYSFDIPYPTLTKIVKRIASEANIDQNNVFIFYDDRSFMIKKFVFSEYENFIAKQSSEVKFLTDTYVNYLKAYNVDINSQPSIFEFLDKNKISLSQFFANKLVSHLDHNYLTQARFINSVKENHELYTILKRVYLGSIISSYLEVDYGEIKDKELEFLLDTNFIVSILDLHSEQSYHTCSKIAELCRKYGFKLKVLNFTIEETKALLNRTAKELQNVKIFEQLDSDSIDNACHRRRLNKTDLEKITSELERNLIRNNGIHIISDKNILKERAKTSEIYKRLQNRRVNPDGALHDAVAILYVKEKRGKEVERFDEVNCWFVIDSKNESMKFMRDGKFLELIRAEDLINILWLTNPKVNVEEIAEISLTQLVSATINNSLPNPRVLKELDENIQKYAVDKIEPVDCIRLASNVASQTVLNMNNIEELNRLAKQSPIDFVNQLKEYAEQSKAEEKSMAEATNILIGGLKADLEKRLKEKESSLKGLHEKEIREEKETIVEKDKLVVKISDSLVKEKEENYSRFIKIKDSLDKKAKRSAEIKLWFIIGFYILEFLALVFCTFKFGWSIMAPFVSFIGLGSVILGYVYFAVTKKDLNPITIYKDGIESNKERNYRKFESQIQVLSATPFL
jgi:hypothetical protein